MSSQNFAYRWDYGGGKCRWTPTETPHSFDAWNITPVQYIAMTAYAEQGVKLLCANHLLAEWLKAQESGFDMVAFAGLRDRSISQIGLHCGGVVPDMSSPALVGDVSFSRGRCP